MKKQVLSTILLSTVLLSQGLGAIQTVSAGVVTDGLVLDNQSSLPSHAQGSVSAQAQTTKVDNLTEAQKEATSQLEDVQSKVSALESEQASLQEETERLEKESKDLEQDISSLSKEIVSRKSSIEGQARSAQTSGVVLDYVNTVVNSKSISEAISKVTAMNKILSASNKQLEQQKKDKEEILSKQEKNNDAINKVIANKEKLEDDAQALNARKAELEVAKLNLEAEKAEAEGQKAEILAQKADAEVQAAQAVAEEKAYLEKKESEKAIVASSANTSLAQEVAAVSPVANVVDTVSANSEYVAPKPANRPRYSTTATSYPIGECTWGVKTLAPWAGDYWGNGAQWATSARADGFRTGSVPQVGSIICWDDGGYGHVAVVTAVESATRIQVSESNYNGNRSIGNYRGWFNPNNFPGAVSYIYPN